MEGGVEGRVGSRERNPQNPRNPTKDQEMGKHPNPKPQTTRTQDPTQVLVGEGKRGKQRSQDPQMGTSLAQGETPIVLYSHWQQRFKTEVGGLEAIFTHPETIKYNMNTSKLYIYPNRLSTLFPARLSLLISDAVERS